MVRRSFNLNRWLKKIIDHTPFRECYTIEDNTEVIVYTNKPGEFGDYPLVHNLPEDIQPTRKVSLITTVRNEADNIDQWMNMILTQTRKPDEIVIVDAGSTDGTLQLIKSRAASSSLPIRILEEPGANIARGRNIAVRAARHEIIAVTDLGAYPNTDWLEKLIEPFEISPDMDVVMGWYVSIDDKGKLFERRSWPRLDQVKPQQFIPSSRSLAFHKKAWASVQGYPEWLSLTGEDTYFALELKRTTFRWAFAPEAVVQWYAPTSIQDYWAKQRYWSVGDGESGVNAKQYQLSLLRLLLISTACASILLLFILSVVGKSWIIAVVGFTALLLWITITVIKARHINYSIKDMLRETGVYFAQVSGFLSGYRQRETANLRRFEQTEGVFIVLSGVPIDDTGGGARAAQFALELLRKQYLVVFINKFPKYESIDLKLSIRHPNLLKYTAAQFNPIIFMQKYGTVIHPKTKNALIEFPLADYLEFAKVLKTQGVHVIYDLLDEWNSSLGGSWYSKSTEKQIIDLADSLVATAPTLVGYLENQSSHDVYYLPNAVNDRLFNPKRHYPIPIDFPKSDRSIIYIGALWGEWFDWDLLGKIGQQYADWALVIIGDYQGQCPNPTPNMHFLGLKKQVELPAYLAHAKVAIIPWKVNLITQATSPLKVYEYIAMQRPVIAPDLPLLKDLPSVYLAANQAVFLEKIKLLGEFKPDIQLIDAFISQNCWNARVNELISFTD